MGILSFFKKIKENKYDDYYDEEKLNKKEVENIEEYNNKVEDKNIDEMEYGLEEIKDVEISKEEAYTLIIREILNIVDLYDNFNEVRFAAREAAIKIGKNNLKEISKFLNKKIDRETKYITRYSDEEWNIVVENTILMIIYSFREDAVSILEEISKENSRLSLKTINLLCKLASEKVKTEEIVDWTMNRLVDFNDEIKIVILGFMSQIKGNNSVINGEIEYAIKTLNHLINVAEKYTNGHLNFLRSIALNKKTIKLSEIMGLDKDDPEFINISNINEELSI